MRATSIKSSFTPITLFITIESMNELHNLWHRFNISNKTLSKEAQPHQPEFSEEVYPYRVLNELRKLIDELNPTEEP